MTGTELQRQFGVHLNQFDDRLEIGSRDIFIWLTEAQRALIDAAFAEFDRDRTIGNMLLPFTEVDMQTTDKDIRGNDTTDLPGNYLYTLAVEGNVDGVWRPVRIVQKDDLFRLLVDPFHTTKYDDPMGTVENGKVVVYNKPDFEVSEMRHEYVRRPNDVTRESGTELDPGYHNKLVSLAVTLFLDNTRGLKDKLQRETPLA